MTSPSSHPAKAEDIQRQLEKNRLYIQEMFDVGASGQEMAQALSDRTDVLLCKLWRKLAPELIGRVELVSVGGFGRGELAPGSDLDLWFIFPAGANKAEMEKVQPFLYAVWDMGLKIGYAIRTVRECIAAMRDDWNTATAAMEARLVFGRGELFQLLQENITKFFKRRRQQFAQAKLNEMEQRHTRTGKTAFLMEPDLKEGIGGLRDIQTVFWLAKAWYGVSGGGNLVGSGVLSIRERQLLLSANDFLWRCRIGLHLNQGRARDRLSFEQQALLASSMGYTTGKRPAVERFMKDYFRHAGRVVRLSGMITMHFHELLNPHTFSLSHTIEYGLTEENERVEIGHEAVFREQPLRLIQVFQLAQQGHRDLSSSVLRRIRADVLLIDDEIRQMPETYEIFMNILRHRRNVAWAIKAMNDTGVLGRLIPEFRHIVGLGQFNRYHAYTVDEHTLRAIGEARNFKHGLRKCRTPLAAEVMARITRPELLYLALIFHDIAKGMDGDHSEVGAKIAYDFCCRAQLDAKACKLVPWLVTHHLTMALISQRYDISDQEVVSAFSNQVETRERLDYLYCLTVADIAAVGPQVWTVWKGSLLADLYHATAQTLLGDDQAIGNSGLTRIEHQRQAALALVAITDRTEAEAGLIKLPANMMRQLPDHRLALLAIFLGKCSDDDGVDTHVDHEHGGTLVMVHSHSRNGLFAALAGVMNACRVSVVAAQGFDMDNGYLVDMFLVQNMDGSVLDEGSDLARLRARINKTLASEPLPAHHSDSGWKIHVLMREVTPQVRLLPRASAHYSVVEVTAADRPGILADLAAAINRCQMRIHGVQISTFGERLVDVFFLERIDGLPPEQSNRQQLFAELTNVITLPKEVADES